MNRNDFILLSILAVGGQKSAHDLTNAVARSGHGWLWSNDYTNRRMRQLTEQGLVSRYDIGGPIQFLITAAGREALLGVCHGEKT